MSEIRLAKFKSDDEEAAFWDSFDTAQIMEEGEEIEWEYKPETAIKIKLPDAVIAATAVLAY